MRAILVLAVLGVCSNQAPTQPPSPGPSSQPAPDKPAPPPAAAAPAPAAKAPPAAPTGTVRSFDSAKVSLAWNNRRWQLVHGGEVLKDFGSREQEARQALRVIQELRLDGHGTIGGPQPVMEYWLAGGQAPRAVLRGLHAAPLEAERLRVEQVQGQWCLRDGSRVLFNFGPGAADAREALAVLQKYHFDQVGVIGRSAPAMYLFVRRPNDGAPALPEQAASHPGGRQMKGPNFSRLAKNKDGTPRFEKKMAAPGAGLESVVTPALPALAPAAAASDWHGQPHFGHRKLQAPAPASDRAVFDWRQAQLRQVGGEWALQCGGLTLARFGTNFREGQQALSALRHYRFTEQRRIGDPAITLYAPTAQSPRGVLLGLHAVPFAPEKLAVQNVAGQFALVEGSRVVLTLGGRKDDATKVLEMVKRQGYDRLCKLGDSHKDGMTFFVRSR